MRAIHSPGGEFSGGLGRLATTESLKSGLEGDVVVGYLRASESGIRFGRFAL
jgi:hypothetical protein